MEQAPDPCVSAGEQDQGQEGDRDRRNVDEVVITGQSRPRRNPRRGAKAAEAQEVYELEANEEQAGGQADALGEDPRGARPLAGFLHQCLTLSPSFLLVGLAAPSLRRARAMRRESSREPYTPPVSTSPLDRVSWIWASPFVRTAPSLESARS